MTTSKPTPRQQMKCAHAYDGYEAFVYVRHEETDIRKTFEKYRKAQKPVNVTPIKKVKP